MGKQIQIIFLERKIIITLNNNNNFNNKIKKNNLYKIKNKKIMTQNNYKITKVFQKKMGHKMMKMIKIMKINHYMKII